MIIGDRVDYRRSNQRSDLVVRTNVTCLEVARVYTIERLGGRERRGSSHATRLVPSPSCG